MRVREAVYDVLMRRNISYVFGNPGSTELPLLSGLPAAFRYVLCLHEHVAVAAGAGLALVDRRAAFVNLHAAPGVANAAGAMAWAQAIQAPLVVTAGQQDTRHLRGAPLLSGPLKELGGPFTKWQHEPVRPLDVPFAIEKAFKVAETPPKGPVLVSLPADFLEEEGAEAPRTISTPRVGNRLSDDQAASIANELTKAERCVIIAGAGVDRAGALSATISLAEALRAPTYAAPVSAQSGFPTDHPLFMGHLPPHAGQINGRLSAYDHIIVLGAPAFTLHGYSEASVFPERVEVILISDSLEDAVALEVGEAYVCDIAATVEAVVQDVVRMTGGQQGQIEEPGSSAERDGAVDGAIPGSEMVGAVCEEIIRHADPGTRYLDESISCGPVVRDCLRIGLSESYLRSPTGALGSVLPAAIGMAMAAPDPVVVLIGDGSLMYTPQALWTIQQLELDVKVVVLNNRGYGVMGVIASKEYPHLGPVVGDEVPGLDMVAQASSVGMRGLRATVLSEVEGVVGEALGEPGPCLMDIDLTGR